MHNFKELKIWQFGIQIAEEVYLISKGFPQEEQFGLTSQLRRAAISIPSNIAEGAGRKTDKDFNRFLDMANGSINEVETQVLLALRLGFVEPSEKIDELLKRLDEVQKMIFSLQKSLITRP